ncbi:MAG: peptidase domain protein [Ignavibacteria bacterium]|nr:peptidase domain protein [Ignavibacteria bacterium]
MKKLFSHLLTATLFIVLAFNLQAQMMLAPPTVKTSGKLPSDPAVTIGTLDNGIKYYVRVNHKPEKRAEMRIVIRAASAQEDDDQMGLAHFTEHMCFNGTKNFPKNDLVNFLESTGMRFGADLNANTGFDRTYYLFQIPTDKEGMLEKGVQVLEEWAHNVTFDETELNKERGVILEEWRLYRGANERVMKQHYPVIFKGSKYADRLPIGDTSIILNAPREAFLRYYHDWYRPDLMAVIAVGDFDKNEVIGYIKKHFSKIEPVKNPRPRVDYDIPSHKEILVSVAKDKELTYPNIALFFKHKEKDQSTAEGYRSNMVERIMSTMINQRMGELTRKANPPFLYGGVDVGNFVGSIRVFQGSAVVKAEDIKTGAEAMFTEVFKAKLGFNKSEMDRTKQEMLRSIEEAYAERDKTESRLYAEEYYRNFHENEAMPGVEYELELYKKFLPEITLEEVNNCAKDMITMQNGVIILSAQDKSGITVPTEGEILALFNEVASRKIEAYTEAAITKPLMEHTPKAGTVVKESKIPELNITEWKLSNGIRVILKPTDFKNDEIQFRAYSPGGTSQASDADFVSALAADDIVNEAGIGEFDMNTLEKMLTGKIVRVTPMISDLTEGFMGQASPKDMETMFQLIHLYFSSPRKDKEAFESYIEKTKQMIKNGQNSPEGVFRDSVTVTVTNYNMRSKPMTEEMLSKVDLDKAYSFYQNRFADASDFTFFFVGSFEPDKFRIFVETYIASLPNLSRKENWKDLSGHPPKGQVQKEVKKGIENKSSVNMIISGDLEFNRESRFIISSLIELLNIKLRESIREEKGGVYGIGARPSLYKYPKEEYRVSIGFGCNPQRVEELITECKNIIEKLKNDKIEPADIEKVREIKKREFETNLKQNSFWVGNLYSYYLNNEDPALLLQYPKLVENLSEDALHAAAKKYLKTDNFIRMVLNPEKQ